MSSYSPPIEDVAIFDTALFRAGDAFITQSQADKRYLRFPNAQGTENLQAINVNGLATFSGSADIVQQAGSQILQAPASTGYTTNGNALNETSIRTNFGQSTNPTLEITDISSNNTITIVPNALNNAFDPIVAAGDSVIASASATAGAALTLTNTNSLNNNTNGLRLASNFAVIGYGGSTDTPSNRIGFDSGGINVIGAELSVQSTIVAFTSTTPPTSAQTIPAANDSSTKIPTTAWVQSAISAGGGSTLLTSNNTWTGTNDFTNTTTMDKPLTMTGTINNDRIINNVYYQLQDATNLANTTGQIYASSGNIIYDNDSSGGSHTFACSDASGVQTNPLVFTSLNLTINTTNPPTQTAVQPASNDSSNKIPTTAWVQGAISAGGGSALLTSNNTWTGTQNWTNTSVGSLTSSATQPASNDSSTKIPTTAWVQSAIASIPVQFVPKFVNYTDVQTTSSASAYSSGPLINFGGTWGINDIVYIRVTSQLSYNDAGSGYQNTGNTSGLLYFRPYYMTAGWAPVSGSVVIYTQNIPSSQMGAAQKPAYYVPSFNVGNIGKFCLTGGTPNGVRVSVLSPATTNGWEFFVSLEYLGARTSAGTISFANGGDTTGINNTLP